MAPVVSATRQAAAAGVAAPTAAARRAAQLAPLRAAVAAAAAKRSLAARPSVVVRAVAAPPAPAVGSSKPKALADQEKSLQKPTVVITGEQLPQGGSQGPTHPTVAALPHRTRLL